MPEHRRKFSPQFKAEAMPMVISTGKPIAEVARDVGIAPQVPTVQIVQSEPNAEAVPTTNRARISMPLLRRAIQAAWADHQP